MRIYSYRIIFSFLFLCGVLCLFAQDSAVPAESDIILQSEETAIKLQEEAAQPPARNFSTVSVLIQLILSLGAVCLLIYGVLYFIRRSRHFKAGDDPFLKTVASLPLAPNKTLYIVTLINKAYLIAAADSALSLIAEITDKELIDAMNIHAAQTAGPKQDFNTFLHTFFPAARPKEADSGNFDSFLTKQRERLHGKTVYTENQTEAQQ